ncbi:two-component system LytT family sensor kinase [Chryseobacterium sp. H1D6B]|uniref:sensor histidine kinase n=1 Tax=Chryseobacterium sp. H1D6B TaxID=2940588 RepID=UPI0015CA67AD|nr:histidine kinase [Chryseobacterium sp. H1D6B]MDH6251364.1 two-component system LytT family sensor kinase [Chryseobacterium sp. H1D6B]
MKKKQFIYLHVFYWAFYIIKEILVPVIFFKRPSLAFDITFFITSFTCFYFNYFWVVPRFFDINKIFKSVIGYFISVVCFVLVRYFVEEVLLPKFFGFRNYAEGTSLAFYFYDNIYFSFMTIFVSTVFCLFKLFSQNESEKLLLITEKKNAELQALKTQINPHFIFNSLNNIYSLVYQNSDKALPAIEELSRLLRYSTKDLEKEFILLEKEIEYLESLIALESLRIKNPELLIVEKSIHYPKLSISPMLLVPFVENAFKHGDFRGKGFTLKISDDQEKLQFYLHNFKKEKKKDNVSGIGIGNVKKRLEILYPKKHELTIEENESEFTVHLNIDFSK